ncbi:hypothetical protein GCK72_015523 [Caenorhabditis remanei]|uniref:Uncharacterized protein n=1 Tax=Caenorhabditis remanei TaxID=31234 RepID=A0A6A5GXA7_CAERE|nr:hypothetical protein GCK72_015523 [Caenorhabditis remanei]KAF1759063.1 hypothetical protein GCK72_015523 [Caenorhabditis remanei]
MTEFCFKNQLTDGQICTVCKAKGITLNSVADKMVTFDNMKVMVDEVFDGGKNRTVVQLPQFTMRRDRDHKVYGQNIKKAF